MDLSKCSAAELEAALEQKRAEDAELEIELVEEFQNVPVPMVHLPVHLITLYLMFSVIPLFALIL